MPFNDQLLYISSTIYVTSQHSLTIVIPIHAPESSEGKAKSLNNEQKKEHYFPFKIKRTTVGYSFQLHLI